MGKFEFWRLQKFTRTSHAKASTHTLLQGFTVGMTNCIINSDISCIGKEMSGHSLLMADIIQGSLTLGSETEKQTPPLIDEHVLKKQQEERHWLLDFITGALVVLYRHLLA